MIKAYLVMTDQDMANFAAGKKPDNSFLKEFGSEAELKSYEAGLTAVHDLTEFNVLAEYKVKGESKTALSISFDDEDPVEITFDSNAEKEAYKLGLDDGDGFNSPDLIKDDDDRFEDLHALMDAPAASSTPSPGM